jgi:DNA damage-inducible protein 1
MHLLDNRFEGIAVGVGSSKILGRIHLADMEIGGVIL